MVGGNACNRHRVDDSARTMFGMRMRSRRNTGEVTMITNEARRDVFRQHAVSRKDDLGKFILDVLHDIDELIYLNKELRDLASVNPPLDKFLSQRDEMIAECQRVSDENKELRAALDLIHAAIAKKVER